MLCMVCIQAELGCCALFNLAHLVVVFSVREFLHLAINYDCEILANGFSCAFMTLFLCERLYM